MTQQLIRGSQIVGGGGGGGVTVTRVTITPSTAVVQYSTSVVDGAATGSSKVNASLVLNTSIDQNGYDELATMNVFAVPDSGTITFTLTKTQGPFVGPFYVDYFLT